MAIFGRGMSMFIFKPNHFKFVHRLNIKRNKYIVLLPEIPTDTVENNPLLRPNGLPAFTELSVDKCINGIGKLVIEHETGIHKLDQQLYDADVKKSVQNVILPLDRLSGPLDFAWGAFKLLYIVRNNESFADAYVKLHPRIIKAKREKYFSSSIYQAFKELKAVEKELTTPVQRIIDKHLLESQFSGVDLSDNAFKYFQSIMIKLDKHRATYKKKLQLATERFYHILSPKDVQNFPQDILKMVAEDPTNPTEGPWRVTLQPEVYNGFMKYCDNRMLRWNAWYAHNIRASSTSGMELNNSIEIEEIRNQRSEFARLMGFDTFAKLSMQTKMAGTVENVMELLTTLHVKSESCTKKELKILETFARDHGFPDELQLWDIPYWARRHKEHLYNLDEAVIRDYFPLPVVLRGLFQLCKQMFGITIQVVDSDIDVWHKDVSFYKIYDESEKEIASFYLDPYKRPKEKASGAWLEAGRNRSDVTGSEPISYLILNFQPPSSGKPCLLSFEDLKTLFAKFGHLLQQSLTMVPFTEVAGLTNLEWDVVHVCPLVMGSFLKHYHTVAQISAHTDTQEPIPQELHDRLLQADQHLCSLHMTEEVFLSVLDLELYSKKEFWTGMTKRLWLQYMPFPYEKNAAKPCSFPEIFSDAYPAAYFSSLWAEMIAADVFSAFTETGLDNKEAVQQIGRRFRDTFLALGGGYHPGEVFRKFRGRDPCIDALLVSYGLTKS